MSVTDKEVEASLLPCPFCGGEGLLFEWSFDSHDSYVECSVCHVTGPAANSENETWRDPATHDELRAISNFQAIAAWNRRSAAAAVRAEAEPVAVKPLEWELWQDGEFPIWKARMSIGVYEVGSRWDGTWCWWSPVKQHDDELTDEDNAKAAAQADFEQRIRSCLNASPPRPVPQDAGVVEHLRHLADVASTFLRHFNPFDMPEDKSQQWQALHREIELARAALSQPDTGGAE